MSIQQNFKNEQELSLLVAGYLNGNLSPDQEKELNNFRQASVENEQWFQAFCEEANIAAQLKMYYSADKASVWNKTRNKIIAETYTPAIRKVNIWWRITAAAAVVIILATAGLLFLNSPTSTKNQQKNNYANTIAPGKNQASITLANGKTINLSDQKNGVIIDDLALTYNDGSKIQDGVASTEGVQTISTPKGGTYQVRLPDGTQVWLNAASSLTYNTSLNKVSTRIVKLRGEAYFEVAKDKKRPFVVKTDQQQVEVLGTHFNVNAYEDESGTNTTLIEGLVKVVGKTGNKILNPGQHLFNNYKELKVGQANVEETMSWKNGYFRFNDEKIESVMRKLSRWYDIEVQYEGKPSDEEFNGKISMFNNLDKVLTMLEKTKSIHFKVEGRRVTVMK
ncbi:FecR family protein [Pedobacter sp. ASV1-7]|uniref:FecR family protein n=1 Tax=Pedobacter sp. ASV1-7 TaxID=3145237 RepID=UPI0032E859C4